ncbi:MAG TPA: hypothetical protein ENH94_04080 [Phycisphaerales bacterium]|nr:hypothetical protein [Phycisphaerales bacterium]
MKESISHPTGLVWDFGKDIIMDVKGYCKLLMDLKSGDFGFWTYMGKRWFIFKLLILVGAGFMIFDEDGYINICGYFLLGYLLGVVPAGIRSFIASKKMWQFQKEFLDWEKVEKVLEPEVIEGDN